MCIRDRLNVKYVLTSQTLNDPLLRLVYNGPDGKVYQRLHVLPRAIVAPFAQVKPSPDAQLAAVGAPGFLPWQTAVVDKPVQIQRGGPLTQLPSATVTGYSPGKVEVQAAGPGVLVLADNNFPGWKVSVDGKPAELLTADYAFRGVALPPGEHAVEFTFAPTSLFVGGLILSLIHI